MLRAQVLLVVGLAIAIEIVRLRARERRTPPSFSRHPRRQPPLEDRLRDACAEPIRQDGEIFVSYEIWRQEHETRLELSSADAWLRLNEFTARSSSATSGGRSRRWRRARSSSSTRRRSAGPKRSMRASTTKGSTRAWSGRSVGSGDGAQFVKDP